MRVESRMGRRCLGVGRRIDLKKRMVGIVAGKRLRRTAIQQRSRVRDSGRRLHVHNFERSGMSLDIKENVFRRGEGRGGGFIPAVRSRLAEFQEGN